MNKLLIVFIGAFMGLLSSCASKQHQYAAAGPQQVEGVTWLLSALGDKAFVPTADQQQPSLMFLGADKRYSIQTGCNGLGGNYSLNASGKITFKPGFSTLMACEDMRVEMEMKNIIATASTLRRHADTLLILGKDQRVLARFTKEQQQEQALTGSWELQHIASVQGELQQVYPHKLPLLTFDVENSRVSGTNSCNSLSGSLKIDGNNIQLQQLISTRMACPGKGEQLFMEALAKVNRFSVSRESLTLMSDDVAILSFRALR